METDRVRLFNEIRDTPYRIPLAATEIDQCCTGKHKRLKAQLEETGLSVRWRVCTFKWSDIPLPTEVSEIAHADNSTHAYLEVERDGVWKKVDATWDSRLSSILPVTEWDGDSDTALAVPSLETYSPEESAQIISDESSEIIERDLKINKEFYSSFNQWLEQARGKLA